MDAQEDSESQSCPPPPVPSDQILDQNRKGIPIGGGQDCSSLPCWASIESPEVPPTSVCDAPTLVVVPGDWPSVAVVIVHRKGGRGSPQSAPSAPHTHMPKIEYTLYTLKKDMTI